MCGQEEDQVSAEVSGPSLQPGPGLLREPAGESGAGEIRPTDSQQTNQKVDGYEIKHILNLFSGVSPVCFTFTLLGQLCVPSYFTVLVCLHLKSAHLH